MTAFIGYCLDNGACLAADGQRNHYDKGTISQVKKIVKLTPEIVIATGGLGTIGHSARNRVIDSIEHGSLDSNDLDSIVTEIQEVFSQAYERSLDQRPDHGIPLYALLAGRRPSNGTGFICSLKSNNGFQAEFFDEPASPYFTGSSTHLVQRCSSEVYYRLKDQFSFLPFDLWATKSIQCAANQHQEIGFPVQLTHIDSQELTDRFPVNGIPAEPEERFKVGWDGYSLA